MIGFRGIMYRVVSFTMSKASMSVCRWVDFGVRPSAWWARWWFLNWALSRGPLSSGWSGSAWSGRWSSRSWWSSLNWLPALLSTCIISLWLFIVLLMTNTLFLVVVLGCISSPLGMLLQWLHVLLVPLVWEWLGIASHLVLFIVALDVWLELHNLFRFRVLSIAAINVPCVH